MLITGYMFYKKENILKLNSVFVSAVAISSFIFIVFLQMFCFQHGIRYTVWYNAFPLIVTSAAISILMLKVTTKYINKQFDFILKLARLTFGVYLLHWPILMIIKRYLVINVSMPLKVMSLFVLTFIISFMVVAIGAKSKIIRKNLFYIK